MLNSDRHRRGYIVQYRAVQRPSDRFVISDRSEPAVTADIGGAEDTCQIRAGVHFGRTHPNRRQRRCRRTEMDVVIMQTRDYRPTVGVVDLLTG